MSLRLPTLWKSPDRDPELARFPEDPRIIEDLWRLLSRGGYLLTDKWIRISPHPWRDVADRSGIS